MWVSIRKKREGERDLVVEWGGAAEVKGEKVGIQEMAGDKGGGEKREARKQVAVAKRAAWEQWSGDLGTAGGRAKMFKVAKQMRRDRRDVEGTNFIEGEDGVIKVDGGEVCERWRGYFQELLNGENECEFGEEGTVEGPLNVIIMEEVEGHEKW